MKRETMSFENLMRTTEYLDQLDPLRPALRRLAMFRFDEGEFSEFLEDLERWPQWRFSPTARFLAAKAYVQLGQSGVADEHREVSWNLWEEIREDEEALSAADGNRLEFSYMVLDAQIHRCRSDLDGAERLLGNVERGLERCRTKKDSYDDFDQCLESEMRAVQQARDPEYVLRPKGSKKKEQNHGVAGVSADAMNI